MKIQPALASALLAAGITAAHASSDDAWGEFQAAVEKACVSAAKGLIENGRALVDPFGSENYGLAIVTGKAKGAKTTVSALCVFDKKTEKAEIGGEFGADVLKVTLPKK